MYLLLLLLLLPTCFLAPRTQAGYTGLQISRALTTRYTSQGHWVGAHIEQTFPAGEIIGGHEARPHSHPYMACLKTSEQDPQCFCGGFLIQENFVLTAAHCSKSSIIVILGAHNIKRQERSQQVIRVDRVIPHHDYKPKFINDIMLLKLEKKAKLNAIVQLLKLPGHGNQVKPGQVCSVAGWGRLAAPHGEVPDKLQEVDLTIQDDCECESRFISYDKTIQLCAGEPEETKCPFAGDSGGPLMCKNVAQGIVSYGKKSGRSPTVYTKISNFLPWIDETMKQHED